MKKILLTTALLLLIPFGSVGAAGMMDVVFEQDPLFGEMNMKPGDSVTRTVTVTNNDTVDRQVYTGVNSTGTNGGLADALQLTISSPLGIHFSDTLSSFLATSSVNLNVLESGASRVYTFEVDFASASGNSYQATTAGFDLLFGFGPALIPDDNGGNGGGGGGGGGGSSGGSNTNNPDNTGPTPQIAGASDSTPNFLESLINGTQRYLDSLAGRVLGESTSAQEPENEEVVLEEVGELEGANAVVAGANDGKCAYWWLFVLLWLIASALAWFIKGREDGRLSLRTVQVIFGPVALVFLIFATIYGVDCLWWPALIVLLGSILGLFLGKPASGQSTTA